MKTNIKIGIVLTIVAVLVVLLNFAISRSREGSQARAVGKADGQKSRARESGVNDQPLIYKLRLSDQRFEEADAERILEHFGHSAESLVLVFLMTSDFSRLGGLSRFKESKAAAATLATYSIDLNERLFWARHLLTLDPNNGAASILVSTILVKLGRVEEAKEMLKQAEGASFFSGNNEAVSALLPDMAKVVPKSYIKAFVFDDLPTARSTGVRALFPERFDELFAGKKKDEILSLAKSYIAISDKVSNGAGFSIGDDAIRRSSVSHECKAQKALVLSALERALGIGSSLELTSVSAQSLTNELTQDFQRASDKYSQLTEEKMQEIITSVLQTPAK